MSTEATADRTLDATGLACPMPVVQTKSELEEMTDGEVLEILATDPGAEEDIPALASRTNNEFLGVEDRAGDKLALYLKRTD